MRLDELTHHELLELDSQRGVIRFSGQRTLLLDAVAMGLLRQYLVENFGLIAARAVLTQFGFAHGWRMAAAARKTYDWTGDEDLRRGAARICTLQGLFVAESGADDPQGPAGLALQASYEAEQHLLHFGQSDSAVCWTLCGLLSGYCSQATGTEVYVLEGRCLGQGHAACHLVGHTRDEWGDEHSQELAFFDSQRLKECLDVSLSRVTDTLKSAEAKLRAHRRKLVRVAPGVEEPLGVVAKSPQMARVVDLALRVAKVDATVLISGETGVGKERIARMVHDGSARAGGPFIAVNCGAMTESLLQSELFGHARGAFTGAAADRPGIFEAANHGTLFLDEIGEVSASMQVQLLRVLQEREVRRIGENRVRPVNVRILAATNRDLKQEIVDGGFRNDLYYRLKVVELVIPPLRARKDDILPLARVLLGEAAVRMSTQCSRLTPKVADLLLRYDWPGNVRELQNAMERAAALAVGEAVTLEDLPEEVRRGAREPLLPGGVTLPLREIEKNHILATLDRFEGNQALTARELGIGSATLYRKLKQYGRLRKHRKQTPSM